MLQQGEREENCNAQQREQSQRGKHTGDLQTIAGFEDSPRQACRGPRPGAIFSDDGPDQSQPAATGLVEGEMPDRR